MTSLDLFDVLEVLANPLRAARELRELRAAKEMLRREVLRQRVTVQSQEAVVRDLREQVRGERRGRECAEALAFGKDT